MFDNTLGLLLLLRSTYVANRTRPALRAAGRLASQINQYTKYAVANE